MSFDPDALDRLYDRARRAERKGDRAAATRLFRECLAMDPDDHCGVTLRLAALGDGAPLTAPPAYVATLFDQHADTFDDILVGQLGYGVPTLARTLVGRHAAGPFRMLDLGCGTGLAGIAFADVAPEIVGVDLSEAILAHADERGVYTELYVGEAVAFLDSWDDAPFSLVVATDVFPYLGDLAPFALAAAAVLAPGGLLVASTERRADGWGVTATQRFSHATAYVTETLAAAGLATVEVEAIVVRHEEGVPVEGDLVLARAG
jgi:predicted TPR repeat methyltransferase